MFHFFLVQRLYAVKRLKKKKRFQIIIVTRGTSVRRIADSQTALFSQVNHERHRAFNIFLLRSLNYCDLSVTTVIKRVSNGTSIEKSYT